MNLSLPRPRLFQHLACCAHWSCDLSCAQTPLLTVLRTRTQELGDEGAFPDMGIAVWFMLVTFSTVGYGDYSPNSHMGKALTSVAIVGGLVFMSMPLTIVGNNFSAVWMEKEKTAVVVKIQVRASDGTGTTHTRIASDGHDTPESPCLAAESHARTLPPLTLRCAPVRIRRSI